MKINNISRIPYTGPVYNFHCKPDEKYFSENLLVHNCYKGPTEANSQTQDQNMSLETFKQVLDSLAIDCFKITFENGSEIYATENVEVLTNRGIILVKDLNEDDNIIKVIIDD